MANAPQPVAQGKLDKTPLAHVILAVVDRGLDGTLAVWRDDGARGQDRLLFQDGRIVGARLLEPAATLERGLLPLFFRKAAPYAFYPADLVGDAGTAGDIDVFALLAASLRGGARKEVIDAVLGRYGEHKLRVRKGAPLERYGFVPKERAFLELLRAEPQSFQELLRRYGDAKVVRRTLYLLAITKSLEVFEGEFARRSLTEVAHEAGDRFADLTKTMAAHAKAAQARRSQAPKAPAASPPAAGGADFSDLPTLEDPPPSGPAAAAPAPEPPAKQKRRSGPEPAPPPPKGLKDELVARWVEIADYAETIDGQNYFEMLGVATSAGEDAVRDAYFAKVKKWHPDRLAPDLMPLKPWADRIFHHLTEASNVLSDAEQRGSYLKSVQGGGGTPAAQRELDAVLTAAMEFEKVEVFVRRKDWGKALRLLEEILETAPDEADYPATKGLILFKQHGTTTKARVDEALQWLDRALELNERNERALVTKAQILQRTGDAAAALELFRKVLDVNPKNLDAQRQVRLADMRGTSGGSPSKPPKGKKGKDEAEGGFLSKLFGKKK